MRPEGEHRYDDDEIAFGGPLRGPEASRSAVVELLRDIYRDAGAAGDELDAEGLEPARSRPVWIDAFEEKVAIASTVLSPALVQVLAGADGTVTIERWISGETRPTLPEARRVCIATTIVKRFAEHFPDAIATDQESEDLKSWFLGANPTLGEVSPVEFIRLRSFREAAAGIAAAAVGTFA